MQRQALAAAIVAASLVGSGYIIGQITGVPHSQAASTSPTQPSNGSPPHFGHGWFHSPIVAGQVTTVAGNVITVKPLGFGMDRDASVTTIVLGNATTFKGLNGTAATKSSIKTGVYVFAAGTLSADGKTLTATMVAVSSTLPTARPFHGGPGGLQGPHAHGQVASIQGNTVTLKPQSGRGDADDTITTVILGSGTTYMAPGKAAAAKSDIKAGSYLVATGTVSSDGKTLTASRVVILPSTAGAEPFGPHFHHFGDSNGNALPQPPFWNSGGESNNSGADLNSGTSTNT